MVVGDLTGKNYLMKSNKIIPTPDQKIVHSDQALVVNCTAADMINSIIALENNLTFQPWKYPDEFEFSMDRGYGHIPQNTLVSYHIGILLNRTSSSYDHIRTYDENEQRQIIKFKITECGKRYRTRKLEEYEAKKAQEKLEATTLLEDSSIK